MKLTITQPTNKTKCMHRACKKDAVKEDAFKISVGGYEFNLYLDTCGEHDYRGGDLINITARVIEPEIRA